MEDEELRDGDGIEELRGKIIDEKYARNKKVFRPYQLVFDPTPKQKWHKQLVALIPPLGHEFDCPLEFEQFPYAKYEWLRIMELDKEHKVITPAKREMFYGYCLMVERRKRLMLEWDGKEDYKAWFDKKKSRAYAKMDYLMYEIERLNVEIDRLAWKMNFYRFEEAKNEGTGYQYDYDDEESETVDEDGEWRYTAPADDSDLFD